MRFFILLALSLSILSCNNDDVDENQEMICSAVSCFSYSIALDLVDQNTKENLLSNNTLNAENLKLIRTSDQSEVTFYLNTDNIIFISSNRENRDFQKFEYQLQSFGEAILNISFDSKEITSSRDCCIVLEIKNVEFDGATSENLDSPYYYRVLLDL
ncbi:MULTISPECIES: hypothetical protein [unclassified Leeuwenhoekiella]|uniref:hypothetical protein n=1 Tax=unclassified Leeuwenhoekiella TaxID=2615029 RepID=UPI000C449741|nr:MULTISPECIES: hypothetical protein [unclassified Leeuwenhoekiella]MAW97191.1 hypothetical protein [Leeuwenhoekiella sp.]MBA82723.1 hypothetical protein [Leeuwenhoekiella sp.]|tara:strand:+ start:31846 stop:32316 length:471 start_codon:yes stop_codon:yes gene_type:complete